MRTDRAKSRAGFTLAKLVLAIAVIGLAVSFIWPTIREAVSRSDWFNKLQQQAPAVANAMSFVGNLPSAIAPLTGGRQRQNSPYLDHDGLSNGFGQASTGTPLPWQRQTSPYLNHQGGYGGYGQTPNWSSPFQNQNTGAGYIGPQD
jgi:hypothetical protein